MPVSARLRGICQKMVEELSRATDTLQTKGTVRAVVRLVGDQSSESTVNRFKILSDEPESVGGGGSGPSPLDFFLSSLGFCENVTFARVAALMGLEFETLETDVRGHWDRRGQFKIGGVEPSFTDITLETRITTKEEPQRVIDAVLETHNRCPVHATLKKATELKDKLFINGQEYGLPS
jgi:putative redox protein